MPEDLDRPCILVIDDDALYASYLTDLLELHGYSVITAVDGAQGIEEYNRRKPVLIITDIYMPNKDGLELLMELRSIDTETPIIALTGSGGTFVNAANSFGANAVIAKPVQSSLLLAKIDELINRNVSNS